VYASESFVEASEVDQQAVLQLVAETASELREKLRTVAPIEMVSKELAIVNSRLDRLEQQVPLVVPIQSLAPEPYDLVKPIEAVVQFSDEEYVASFFDANLSTGGDTQVEAISNLKALIVGTFELLNEMKDSELGPGPGRQKAVLREFIRVR